jgi:hypothetical protein
MKGVGVMFGRVGGWWGWVRHFYDLGAYPTSSLDKGSDGEVVEKQLLSERRWREVCEYKY